MHLLIDHAWVPGRGSEFVSTDPSTGQDTWRGSEASEPQVDDAIEAARGAQESWARSPVEKRAERLTAFAEHVKTNAAELASIISRETGKPRWESLQEANLVAQKIELSIQAASARRSPHIVERDGVTAATRFKPHGVVAVLGPFNLPAHLPNGHLAPALLAGNTVLFKPSEQAPLVGQRLAELWVEANLPAGVLNLVQGGRGVGAMLAQHPGIDGLLFTGSSAAGKALLYACADQPQKILALEMGGNNPLVVWNAADTEAAALLTVQSAFITAGQRCTCARRLILPHGEPGDRLLDRLVSLMARMRIGPWTNEPEPFMGPVISSDMATRLLGAQEDLKRRGAGIVVELKPFGDSPAMLSPGLLDVTEVQDRDDAELFGPLLQIVRVGDFDAAIREANRTAFGLAAGLLSDDPKLYQRFYNRVRAGVVNWNRPTTGASGSLPFGGVGLSGNHRPSGFWACDYCSFPVASLESDALAMPPGAPPGIDL